MATTTVPNFNRKNLVSTKSEAELDNQLLPYLRAIDAAKLAGRDIEAVNKKYLLAAKFFGDASPQCRAAMINIFHASEIDKKRAKQVGEMFSRKEISYQQHQDSTQAIIERV